jgi:hypothetical protein
MEDRTQGRITLRMSYSRQLFHFWTGPDALGAAYQLIDMSAHQIIRRKMGSLSPARVRFARS